MTNYYLNKHEAFGHKGIRGSTVKTQQDFLVLAQEYGRISNDNSKVVIFKAYEKPSKIDGFIKSLDERSGNLAQNKQETSESNLKNIFDIKKQISSTPPEILDFKLKKREIKEKEINELDPRSMLQEIKRLQSQLTDFKSEVETKLDLIIKQLGSNKHVSKNLSPPKYALNEILKQEISDNNANLNQLLSDPKIEYGMPFNIIFQGGNKESNKENNIDKSSSLKRPIIHNIVTDLHNIIQSNSEVNIQTHNAFGSNLGQKLFL